MSHGNATTDGISDRDLDRLVDGQLDDGAQRALLLRLEQQPDAWRRCALAFLESQCWHKDLGALVRAPAETTAGVVSADLSLGVPPAPARRTWRDRVPTLLVMAGSFVFALGLGLVSRGWLQGPGPAPANAVAHSQSPPPAVILVPAAPQTAGAPLQAPPGWRMVTVKKPGDQQAMQVPAVESDQLDENWLRTLPDDVPVELLQALERTGHAVQQSRRLVPMPLEDGRRMVVPVDQFNIHYVGNKAYQ